MSSAVSSRVETSVAMNELTDPVAAAIQHWLCGYVAQVLAVGLDEIDPEEKFDRQGLDSSAAVGLAGDLGTWIGREVDPALTYDFPTIASVSAELARQAEIRAALAGRI